MDSITKFLRRLTIKEQNILLEVIQNILANNLENYDVKKLS